MTVVTSVKCIHIVFVSQIPVCTTSKLQTQFLCILWFTGAEICFYLNPSYFWVLIESFSSLITKIILILVLSHLPYGLKSTWLCLVTVVDCNLLQWFMTQAIWYFIVKYQEEFIRFYWCIYFCVCVKGTWEIFRT